MMSETEQSNDKVEPPDARLEEIMKLLEDNTLVKTNNYKLLQTELAVTEYVEANIAERILTVCMQDLREDVFKNVANIASIISILLKKIKKGQCKCDTSYLRMSAMSILEILPMLRRNSTKTEALRSLCYNTLQMYPDDIITHLALEEFKCINDLIMSCVVNTPLKYDMTYIFIILQRILKIIPPDKKSNFVKDGISVWFSLLPITLHLITENPKAQNIVPVEVFEILTDELVNFDYTDDIRWSNILQHISQSNKYPALLKGLLENGNETWHRLWMILIKLLKKQIIKIAGPGGSPINSMLPVVENAFKMDVINRCRAFECWNVLIDNFSSATNDLVVHKKVKLLIIPLKSNNAKVEETALAKFNTWWHLIRKFSSVLDKYADSILIPFLQFCFGKHTASDKSPTTPPGLLSNRLKQLCIQALVEMFGHINCESCTDIPKLSKKILHTQHLVNNWNDWMYSFMTAVKFMSSEFEDKHKQWLLCLGQSLLSTLGELPENNVRRDLIDNVLEMWLLLIKDEISNTHLPSIILDVLIPSLIKKETNKLNELLFIKGPDKVVKVHKIVKEIIKLANKLFKGCGAKVLVKKLKPLVSAIVEEQCKTFDNVIGTLVTDYEEPLILWTIIAETMFDSNTPIISQQNWHKFLKWPFINPQKLSIFDIKYASLVWFKLFNFVLKMRTLKLDTDLLELLQSNYDLVEINFRLVLALALSSSRSRTVCETVPEVLNQILSKIESYEEIEYVIPKLIESFSFLIRVVNLQSAEFTLQILNKVLRLVNRDCKSHAAKTVKLNNSLPSILKLTLELFNLSDYQTLMPLIANEVTNCYETFKSEPEIKEAITKLLELFLLYINDESTLSKIKDTLNQTKSSRIVDKTTENEFTAPDTNKPVKAKKDKDPSIVDTVVVNGEKYVVLKSQWKFNPKKLTENQKEKLIRKREDIPALYQDLSQSQDEFKLSKWKADFQDNSSSSSLSTSKTVDGDETSNLKNILTTPSNTELVPNIIENLRSDNDNANYSNEDSKVKKNIPTPKSFRTPRMALKDRVFRNVRNLLENSSIKESSPGAGKEQNGTAAQDTSGTIENNSPRTPNNRLKTIMDAVNATSAGKVLSETLSTANVEYSDTTPISKINNDDILKSAPAKICTERPSRAKRKPKKFDDSQLIELKRRKHNISQNDSQSEAQPESEPEPDIALVTNISNNSDANLKNNNDKLDNNNENLQLEIKFHKEKNMDIEKPIGKNYNKVQTENICQDKTNNIKEQEIKTDPKVDSSKHSIMKEACEFENQSQIVIDSLIPSTDLSSNDTTNTSHDQSKSLLTSVAINPSAHNTSGTLCNAEKDCTSKNTISNDTETVNSEQSHEIATLSTPTVKAKKNDNEKTSTKKSSSKKSRIERELAIDTVEGHPLLSNHSSKRTRKKILDFSDKAKSGKKPSTPKSEKKSKNKEAKKVVDSQIEDSVIIIESQEKGSQELCSEDVIESSQDSTMTTVSVTSAKVSKKLPVVALKRQILSQEISPTNCTQSLLDNFDDTALGKKSRISDGKDDTVFPQNKTAPEEHNPNEVTASLDTEPMEHNSCDDVIIINDEPATPIFVNTENTEDIANADTQSIDPSIFDESPKEEDHNDATITLNTQEDVTKTATESMVIDITDKISPIKIQSPLREQKTPSPEISKDFVVIKLTSPVNKECESSLDKDEIQRKQDFLNNTFEISPIKIQSPLRDQNTPSPDTSKDFVVIQLTSPVNSNGEPLEKSNSPEIFSEDKSSPIKRDQSPPRDESTLNITSPSSSLSLKKNRPQVRTNNRALQMLGLCVSNKIESVSNADRPLEGSEEPKRITPVSTPARKNLKMLYNTVADSENVEESEDNEKFLKFKRTLPGVDSSPAGPILKRKLADITDEATISPASKRKRVSFHDPPVSTTVSVQKYIEPGVTRSPQNSLAKRKEREKQKEKGKSSDMKSPKRLDTVFKLDTALTKAVESFSENDTTITSSNDTQMSSLEPTPVVQIVRISDLDDKNPICLNLVECKDPISKIAIKLSSPAMHSLLIKEFEGKIETIGDLAKLTELEVNRLCIKSPKVSIAKKVLNDYLSKLKIAQTEETEKKQNGELDEVPESTTVDAELQTENIILNSSFMQTDPVATDDVDTQTNSIALSTVSVQTAESGSKSTADIVQTCISEKSDFIEKLNDMLDESSKQKIAEKLSFDSLLRLISKQTNTQNSKDIIDQVLNCDSVIGPNRDSKGQLLFLQNYFCDKFDAKNLILFCSQLLQKVYDKST